MDKYVLVIYYILLINYVLGLKKLFVSLYRLTHKTKTQNAPFPQIVFANKKMHFVHPPAKIGNSTGTYTYIKTHLVKQSNNKLFTYPENVVGKGETNNLIMVTL
jgi:hypothetical protein